MPASEYENTVSGGLKLKGAKDAGVKKPKKKKDKDAKVVTKPHPDTADEPTKALDAEDSALQNALEDEDAVPRGSEAAEDDGQDTALPPPTERRKDGKTEAQRRHEETRRKRVRYFASSAIEDGSWSSSRIAY
jgi:protein FAM32A